MYLCNQSNSESKDEKDEIIIGDADLLDVVALMSEA